MAQINKPNEYFNTKLYTGNGTDAHAITGFGFQPDLSWIKSRSSAKNPNITDAVRGATKYLYTNTTGAEATNSATLQSFDSDGFTLGTALSWNEVGQNYVAWNWLASNTTASNTDGSITSTVSANTTAGFSIVKFTSGASAGYSVGHGLGTTPSVIIQKITSDVGGWLFCHKDMSASGITSGYLQLQTTDAFTSNANVFTNVNNSTVTQGSVISNNYEQIMYCFAEKKGFSKFGKYDGNAGVGAFVNNFQYLGFKPAFVMIKCYNAAESWNVFDNKRNGYNYQNNYLIPNTADAEVSAPNQGIDLLSNGFNPYYGTGTINRSGKSYIYMAFAENPLVGTNNIPTTAR